MLLLISSAIGDHLPFFFKQLKMVYYLLGNFTNELISSIVNAHEWRYARCEQEWSMLARDLQTSSFEYESNTFHIGGREETLTTSF